MELGEGVPKSWKASVFQATAPIRRRLSVAATYLPSAYLVACLAKGSEPCVGQSHALGMGNNSGRAVVTSSRDGAQQLVHEGISNGGVHDRLRWKWHNPGNLELQFSTMVHLSSASSQGLTYEGGGMTTCTCRLVVQEMSSS